MGGKKLVTRLKVLVMILPDIRIERAFLNAAASKIDGDHEAPKSEIWIILRLHVCKFPLSSCVPHKFVHHWHG